MQKYLINNIDVFNPLHIFVASIIISQKWHNIMHHALSEWGHKMHKLAPGSKKSV